MNSAFDGARLSRLATAPIASNICCLLGIGFFFGVRRLDAAFANQPQLAISQSDSNLRERS